MSGDGVFGEGGRLQHWVAAIAQGDPTAEREFVDYFLRGVRALVRRHARPLDPIVDDLAQDVMETTLLALRAGRLRDAAALPAYLRSTVVLSVRASYRKRQRRGEDQAEVLDDNLAASDDPVATLAHHQLAATLRRLIGELRVGRDRDLLERFYLREQSKDEVCSALGIDSDHFHRVAFRARERLRELLTADGATYP